MSFLLAKTNQTCDISLSVWLGHLHRRRWSFHPLYASLIISSFLDVNGIVSVPELCLTTLRISRIVCRRCLRTFGCSDLPQTRQLFLSLDLTSEFEVAARLKKLRKVEYKKFCFSKSRRQKNIFYNKYFI